MLDTIRTYEQEISKCLFEIRQTENRTAFSKLREVLKDKDDIIEYFNKGEKSEIKFQVVTQVLNLVLSYLRILLTYIKRSNEFDMIEVEGSSLIKLLQSLQPDFSHFSSTFSLFNSIPLNYRLSLRIYSSVLILSYYGGTNQP